MSNTIKSTMAWVRLAGIPIEFYSERILVQIGNKLGKEVKVDITTLRVERGRYARICVEIDLTQPLISVVTLNGRDYKVEYEGLHLICFDCGKYGHRRDDCPISHPAQPCSNQTPVEAVNGLAVNDTFGPWMVVSSNRRRRARANTAVDTPKMATGRANSGQAKLGGDPKGMFATGMWSAKMSNNTNKQPGAASNGSRFGVLEVDDGDCNEVFDMAIMQDRLKQIPELGTGVSFATMSKEDVGSSKVRQRKGVPIKSQVKVRPQPKSGTEGKMMKGDLLKDGEVRITEPYTRAHLRDLTNIPTKVLQQPMNKTDGVDQQAMDASEVMTQSQMNVK